MTGTPAASATRRKWSSSSPCVGLRKYGVMTDTPAAPSFAAIRLRRITSPVVSAPVPTYTFARLPTCATAAAVTACFSASLIA